MTEPPDKGDAPPPAGAAPATLQELAVSTGVAFLERAARRLREELGVFCVSIGEVSGPAADHVLVHGIASSAPIPDIRGYPIAGTPCHDVVDRSAAVEVATGAATAFPQDVHFREHGIDSYVGLPLRDGFGRTIGLVCAYDTRPMQPPRATPNDVAATLGRMLPRIAAEVAQLRMLRNMLASLSWLSARGDALFAALASHLCSVAQVSTAFVTEWLEDGERFRILALSHLGEPVADCSGLVCAFSELPCGALRAAPRHDVPSGLSRLPADHFLLRRVGADSYAGFRIDDAGGSPLGHVALLHPRPMLSSAFAQSPAVALFAARAGAELAARRSAQQRHEVEATLQASRQLESIGLMAGAIAHDFNNLLATILGSAGLALDALAPGDAAHAHVARIEVAATRAAQVVARLLDFAGRRPAARAAVDLSALAKESVDLVPASRRAGASFELALGSRVPPVRGDATQLQQAIVNLLLNAVDALPAGGGRVRVTTRRSTLDARGIGRLLHAGALQPGACVLLEIADDGRGMDASTLARIFDPFFSGKPRGRGLGMATVLGVVRGHGAGIEVRSRPGAGTTVRIHLPLAEGSEVAAGAGGVAEAASAPPRAAARPATGGAVTPVLAGPVLVVDDEPAVGEVTGAMLSSLGYRVALSADSAAAIDLARGDPPAAAFIDLRMPGLDGWQVLDRLRDADPRLPAVMVSGFADDVSVAERTRRLGVTFVAKPFRQRDLVDALGKALALAVEP
jgi:signal transduction histidine kinase